MKDREELIYKFKIPETVINHEEVQLEYAKKNTTAVNILKFH